MDRGMFVSALMQRGFGGSNDLLYGTYDGFAFTVRFAAPGAASFILQVSAANGPTVKPKALIKAINASVSGTAKVKHYAAYSRFPELISLNVNPNRNLDIVAAFDAVISATVTSLLQLGYSIPAVCPCCHNAGCDAYAYSNNAYRPVHGSCIQNLAEDTRQKHGSNLKTGSYATGAIGALLGAIVGMIPSLLLMTLLSLISGWATMLIPICSYQGYKLLGGKRTKLSVVFVIIASLLVVPVMDYLYTTILLLSYGYSFSVSEYIYYLSIFDSDFIADLAQDYLFTLIGIAFAWNTIRRSGIDDVYDSAFAENSLRPMAQAQPTPQMSNYAHPADDTYSNIQQD